MKLIIHTFILLLLLIIAQSWSMGFAQNVTLTYQGRVVDNGTNFTGIGQFQFALVTSTNVNHGAFATANAPSGGYVTGYTVTNGGNGYTTPPAVIVSGGGGLGAAAHANISGGSVTSISVDSPGNGGYTSTPFVTIAPPPPALIFSTFWSNDGTSTNGSEPAAAVPVSVANGLFTVFLGDNTLANMQAIPGPLFKTPNLQLRIWFNDGVGGFAALSPVQNLTPTPYAAFAMTASNLLNGLTIQQNTNGAPNVVAGSPANYVAAGTIGATISGGGITNAIQGSNSVTDDFGTVGGGSGNSSGNYATVDGGYNNTASGTYASVGGGWLNLASAFWSTVGGGTQNTASNAFATVSGGLANVASGQYSTICGGSQNIASGEWSVACGYQNYATGDYSFAVGDLARANHNNSFVWNDGNGSTFASTANSQFSVHAAGGVRLAATVTSGDLSLSENGQYHRLSMSGGNSTGYLYGSYNALSDGIHLGYNYYYDPNGNGHIINTGGGTSRISADYGEIVLAVGDVNASPNSVRLDATVTGVKVNGTFVNNSDRNAKQDFAPVTASDLLDKVLRLPISEWSYKVDATTRHIGPMAQDFYSVFNIGADDTHIAPIDEGGIAFAAIQGLNQKLEAQNSELKHKDQEIQELRQSIDELKKLILESSRGK